jgi:alkyl hydroperoxide reductase subunit D
MTNLENLIAQIPPYGRDCKINLQNILNQELQILSQKQVIGCALAAALATKEKKLIHAFSEKAKEILSENELNAVKTAASLMAMNNIYYRFTYMTSDKEYAAMPAGLRMQGIANHGIDKIDFEMFSLVASIINGCAICVDAHEKQLANHQIDKKQIQMLAKIAAVINSIAQILLIEN